MAENGKGPRTVNDDQAEATVYEGEIEVYCHRVSFWWELGDGLPLTDELRAQLEEDAEERAKECIIQGYHCGDLYSWVYNGDGIDGEQIGGGWEIDCE